MEIIPIVGISIWTIAKIFVLFAIAIYIVFAFVVVRQVNIMTETLDVGLEGIIKLIAFAHLLFSVGIFILALTIL